MSLVNFTNLDFDQIKTSIKDYLRSNQNFTDYDFEGSNLSTIIDVLAYNTYINAYNASMVTNEVFIDSATLRENVVSLARNIGYVPRSKKCATAVVSFTVDTSEFSIKPLSLTLKKGLFSTSGTSLQSITFSIPEDITVPVIDNSAKFEDIAIYEGTYVENYFTVDSYNKNQRFILDNPSIDTSTIRVNVKDSQNSTVSKNFKLSDSIFEIDSYKKVFFIQEIEDERYEIFFGDGIIGEKLNNQNYITASYIVTSGESGNGASSMDYTGRILDNNSNVVTDGISLISVITSSYGGSEIESIDSIKKYAPRIYASQNRAVTSIDYETIIPKIYPETQSITVYGGEELDPPQYGRVFVAIKPLFGDFIPNSIKDNIIKELRKYSVAGILPEIVDLKYLYVETNSVVYYDKNKSPGENSLQTNIFKNINLYSKSTELNRYGSKFKYSKFLHLIDNTHQSLTSNITTIQIRRDLSPKINQFTEYEICYGNSFHIKNLNGHNIKSSGFYVNGINSPVYFSDKPDEDMKNGVVYIFTYEDTNNNGIFRRNVGRINYEKGEINLSVINIQSTLKQKNNRPVIEISAIPKSNDVVGIQDIYLQLDVNNSSVNMISDTISSGLDISGSQHISTSSYTNGLLIRP
jgi:hypothetical protein